MGRFQGDLLERTFQFAIQIVRIVDRLPNDAKGWVFAKQVLRSGTSLGTNVREADQAPSEADFAHKCSIARKEAAETQYWLELCRAVDLVGGVDVDQAIQEADELTRILASIVKTAQRNKY